MNQAILWVILVLVNVDAFSPPVVLREGNSLERIRTATSARGSQSASLSRGWTLQGATALRSRIKVQNVARLLKIYGASESSGDNVALGDIGEALFGPSQEEIDREILMVSGATGLELFEKVKGHINTHYRDHLKCISLALHDKDEEPWSGIDGSPLVQHAEVIAMDARGFDVSVTVCSEGMCWLAVVHVRFPKKEATVQQLFVGFDEICDRCMCDDPSTMGLCRIHQEIAPEIYSEIANVLNRDFLVNVNNTVSKLAGVNADRGEYISRLQVSGVFCDSFTVTVYFCNFNECSAMEVRISLPRSAADTEDLQQEVASCLEDGDCLVSKVQPLDDVCFMLPQPLDG